MSAIVLGLAALAATANAHGALTGVVADGVYFAGYKAEYYYSGNIPDNVGWYAENLDNGYVGGDQTAYDSPDIICHKAAKPGALSATVKAGGSLAFQWSTWPESHVGPVITYAANCGGDCSTAKKEELKFVKIDAKGYEDGKWAAVDMIATNNTWTMTVPETLAAGNYVFRHEIIALHGAGSENGAQNYPQCVNVEVTGSGTENPEGVLGTELYTSKDDGIIFNPYAATLDYTIPGPPLFGSGSGSGSAPAPGAGNSTAPATSAAAPSASAPAATSAAAPAPSAPAAGNSTVVPEAPATSAAAPAPSAPATSAAAPAPTTIQTSFKPAPTGGAGGATDAAAKYARCGGSGYEGPTVCVDNWVCKEWNSYYSQCVESA